MRQCYPGIAAFGHGCHKIPDRLRCCLSAVKCGKRWHIEDACSLVLGSVGDNALCIPRRHRCLHVALMVNLKRVRKRSVLPVGVLPDEVL